ncbi:hypothetical protein M199_gp115 [Halogranum tailed virus 1]|uniref:Uncharacterized protein n=1 Tax=Halogranum tailed virus 1 TaxID=1273749 RepID=R4TGZ4_9CAUD|nr:hypothetical protein M199_gp115 [Halogranum tailed virus 1]AGM11551.1 hypothetical protein HGTV1_254 [Halogranum tailed virus 1]
MSETIEIKEHHMEGKVVYEAAIPGYGDVTSPCIDLPTSHMTGVWMEAGLTRMEFPSNAEFHVEESENIVRVSTK